MLAGIFVALTLILGGRPAMISVATAAVAVVVTSLVRCHSVEHMFAAMIGR